ncbi:acyl-CoA dehydrogenase family protein [Croceicoccus sp. F390]|uniref:Acyl-CoA dehydrogenase family protein n=1 Tax=Croceicoccus esteveae TaxID=3075597 RepID=A0ABU2ZH48_9SPHN|nr:acyl-CoA dehydrogenase family protein [Croceicoccus sp. F390]MDT0575917.1 acyl-CoA dehydrogenase family protein [Croceicoccus sp. F390]
MDTPSAQKLCTTSSDAEAADAALLRRIAEHAPLVDRIGATLDKEAGWLREAGWLGKCLPEDRGGAGWGCEAAGTYGVSAALWNLGAANLSVARLFEGHVNAVKLVMLLGAASLLDELREAVSKGAMLGVWGADDPDHPVTLCKDAGGWRMTGRKRFASGLGVVDHAIITARWNGATQLAVVPVTDPACMDLTGWNVSGMRATASGSYSFDSVDVTGRLLGKPNAYFTEPFFEGGIWRYCAAHGGAAAALYAQLRAALIASGRAEDPHQQDRMVAAAIAVETIRMWTMKAALAVEAGEAGPQAAAVSLLARQVIHDLCRKTISLVEAALGTAAFFEGTAVERVRRDLAFYLCQAAPDAKRARAAEALTNGTVLAHLQTGQFGEIMP